jgi:hypothetical protein
MSDPNPFEPDRYWTDAVQMRPPTPRKALAHLEHLCDEADAIARERFGSPPDLTGHVATPTIRRVLAAVPPEEAEQEPVLRITEREAGWILGRWTPEKADLAARALADFAHAERAAGNESTATSALDLADAITEAAR